MQSSKGLGAATVTMLLQTMATASLQSADGTKQNAKLQKLSAAQKLATPALFPPAWALTTQAKHFTSHSFIG